jgi:hypothetical protein
MLFISFLILDNTMDFKRFIATFHTFVVAPLLFYVGYNKGKVNKNIFTIMTLLGLGAIGWHLSKLLDHHDPSNWGFNQYINILHLTLVGYLFASVGYRQGKAPNHAYILMLIAAPLVLLYHVRNVV